MMRSLLVHPATPADYVRGVGVTVTAQTSRLALVFRLEADMHHLRIPAPGPGERRDELWKHSCFEVFLMQGQGPAYEEYNFSPSGDWAHYHFVGYRDGAAATQNPPSPMVETYRSKTYLELRTAVPIPASRPLQLGASAVIEDTQGRISYWALHHPSDKPDFHHADAFAWVLE